MHTAEVWYMKPSYHRDGLMGFSFCEKNEKLPNPKNLSETHVLLMTRHEGEPDAIYSAMQGENWSPNGEARELISSLELAHTSMSVGDVIVLDGKALMVDFAGFLPLPG